MACWLLSSMTPTVSAAISKAFGVGNGVPLLFVPLVRIVWSCDSLVAAAAR